MRTSDDDKYQKQCETLMVVMSHTVIDPRTVVIHFHDASKRNYIKIKEMHRNTQTGYISAVFCASRGRLFDGFVSRHIHDFGYGEKLFDCMLFLTPTPIVVSDDIKGYSG